jgi:hypothetical protein
MLNVSSEIAGIGAGVLRLIPPDRLSDVQHVCAALDEVHVGMPALENATATGPFGAMIEHA